MITALTRALRHLRAALRRSRLDDELREEMAQHAEWRAQALVDEGLPAEEARRRATVAIGNVTRLREDARDIWGFPSLDTVVQDLRYGLRLLRRSPAFTSIAVLSLAIGIGASAAVFSLADAALFRKLPVRDPGALVILRWSSGPVSPFASLSGYTDRTTDGTTSTSFSRAAFDGMRRDARMREALRAMAIVVFIVLLVACANVANLLLARGRARARELSVRAAIGASRGRVVRQLLTEGLLLALCGSALGVVAARWISDALRPALSLALPGGELDWRLLAFVAILASVSAVLFALLPALRSARAPMSAGLQEAGRCAACGRHRTRLSGSLVVAQIALSMILVVTAALLVRSVRNLERVDLGLDPTNVLIFRIDPTLNGAELPRVRATYHDVLARLRSAPGVIGATLTSHTLFANSASIGVATRESEPVPDRGRAPSDFLREHLTWTLTVDPDFFGTMRLPILRGRALESRDVDGSQRVAVINSRLAQQLFGSDDVVGRRFERGMGPDAPVFEVVGVAADARYTSVREPKRPTMYVSYLQQPMKQAATFAVRTAGSPEAFVPTARAIVRGVDPNVPLSNVRTQSDQIDESMQQERLFARLATLLGVVTVALSAIGLYGLLAYTVTLREPEIGIRLALGARRGAVGWVFLRHSLWLCAAGLVIGAGAAAAATKVVASLLPPRDPIVALRAE